MLSNCFCSSYMKNVLLVSWWQSSSLSKIIDICNHQWTFFIKLLYQGSVIWRCNSIVLVQVNFSKLWKQWAQLRVVAINTAWKDFSLIYLPCVSLFDIIPWNCAANQSLLESAVNKSHSSCIATLCGIYLHLCFESSVVGAIRLLCCNTTAGSL